MAARSISMAAKSYTLSSAVHVEGHSQRLGERYSFDFKAGAHKPKSEAEEDALEQAMEAQELNEKAD